MRRHLLISTVTIDPNTEHTGDPTNATLSLNQAQSQFGCVTSPCLYGLSSSSTTLWWATPSFCNNVGHPWDPPPHQRSVPWWFRWRNKPGTSHFNISFTITRHTNICNSNINTHTDYHFSPRAMWTTELSLCLPVPEIYRASGSCWMNHFIANPYSWNTNLPIPFWDLISIFPLPAFATPPHARATMFWHPTPPALHQQHSAAYRLA